MMLTSSIPCDGPIWNPCWNVANDAAKSEVAPKEVDDVMPLSRFMEPTKIVEWIRMDKNQPDREEL